jgi:hypothetical protein
VLRPTQTLENTSIIWWLAQELDLQSEEELN